MTRALAMLGGFLLALLAGGFVWRSLSRRRSLPCPAWLVPLLENPYVEAVAGATTLLERARVGPGMRVLDVGSGPGRVTLPAAERVSASGEVVALDIQPGMIRRLEERIAAGGFENVRAVLGGAGEGKVERDGFDRAFLVTVLGEIPDQAAALREIHAALRPGGLLSVTEVLPDPHYQSAARVRRLAEEAGFAEAERFGSFWAFTLNFVKPA